MFLPDSFAGGYVDVFGLPDSFFAGGFWGLIRGLGELEYTGGFDGFTEGLVAFGGFFIWL